MTDKEKTAAILDILPRIYQEPVDWDYIIKNKCLCWFWDEVEETKTLGLLDGRVANNKELFFRRNGGFNTQCRPVRRDEVTFYEDKKDE